MTEALGALTRSGLITSVGGKITILDRAPDLGGTWFYNSYPGAACDVPSHLYSFSFAQRRDWTRLCSPQSEIHDYLRAVARDHGVERHLQLGKTVTSCAWDDEHAGCPLFDYAFYGMKLCTRKQQESGAGEGLGAKAAKLLSSQTKNPDKNIEATSSTILLKES